MKIIYVHDFCFLMHAKRIYTAVGLPEQYFDRFFNIGTDFVNIISRNKVSNSSPEEIGYSRVNNRNISVPILIPNYIYLLSLGRIISIVKELNKSDVVVINFPSIIGIYLSLLCVILRKKYVLEIAADYDQFSSKKLGFIISFFLKIYMPFITKKSSGAIYVSNYLRNKYPSQGIEAVASNVNLNEFKYKKTSQKFKRGDTINLLFAGGVNRRKGMSVLLKAIKLVKDKFDGKFNIILNVAGGHFDMDYMKLSDELGITKNVIFHGIIPRENLNNLYQRSYIYIQPSFTEGIPRATIEAMSYGIPIVATRLPGFEEILNQEFLVSPGSYEQLSDRIINFIEDECLYNKVARENFSSSLKFNSCILSKIREKFFRKVIFNEDL